MRTRASSLLVLAQAAATLCLGVWLLVLRRPVGWSGQWEWKLGVVSPSGPPLLVGMAAMALAIPLAWVLFRGASPSGEGKGARARAFGWQSVLILGTLLWTLAVYAATPSGWFFLHATQLSDVSCEYFGEAYAMTDTVDYLRSYTEHQATSSYHVATHPPGAVLFYRGIIVAARSTGLSGALKPLAETTIGLSAVTAASEVRAIPMTRPVDLSDTALPLLTGVITAILGCLCVVPAAACGRIVWGREGAFAAAALTATLPAVALCFQGLDGPIALLSLAALWAALEAVRRDALVWAAAAGVVLGVALFVSFGAAAAVALCAVVLLIGGKPAGADGGSTRRWRGPAMVGVLFLGIAAVWVPLVVLFRLDPLAMLAHSAEAHHKVIAGFERAYGIWIWLNLIEFACFAGPALVLLAIGAAPAAWRRGGLARGLAVAALGTAVALDLSGTVRAEVGRIWFLLMPPLCILAAGAVTPGEDAGSDLQGQVPLWLPTVLLQCAALIALAVALHPTARPF